MSSVLDLTRAPLMTSALAAAPLDDAPPPEVMAALARDAYALDDLAEELDLQNMMDDVPDTAKPGSAKPGSAKTAKPGSAKTAKPGSAKPAKPGSAKPAKVVATKLSVRPVSLTPSRSAADPEPVFVPAWAWDGLDPRCKHLFDTYIVPLQVALVVSATAVLRGRGYPWDASLLAAVTGCAFVRMLATGRLLPPED